MIFGFSGRPLWRAGALLSLVLVNLSVRNTQASSCSDNAKVILGKPGDFFEKTPGSPEDRAAFDAVAAPIVRQERDNLAYRLERQLESVVADCASQPAGCVDDQVVKALIRTEASKEPGILSRLYIDSCLATGNLVGFAPNELIATEMRRSAGINLLVASTSLLTAYQSSKAKALKNGQRPPTPPFALLAGALISITVRGEIACRNKAKHRLGFGSSGALSQDALKDLSWSQRKLAEFWRYSKSLPALNGAYIGGIVGTDIAMGEPIFTRDKFVEYSTKFGVGILMDAGLNTLNVVILDDLFTDLFPVGRDFSNSFLKKHTFLGQLRAFRVPMTKTIIDLRNSPGFAADILARYYINKTLTYSYIEGERQSVEHMQKLIKALRAYYEGDPAAFAPDNAADPFPFVPVPQ